MRRGWFASIVALSAAAVATDAGSQDLAKELPRVPATEPAEVPATFKIEEGFRLRLAAAEPLVTDPVAAAFDADGRLYVVEMRGYPYGDDVPPGNVRLLIDRDGDGRFDASTIFLDDLSWPTSVVPYDGGVFVVAPPDILYAKDTDGDGKADVRKVLFTGFGRQNVQALANGLLWGHDGWIYGAGGPNGGEIRNLIHPDRPAVSVRGRDFRFKPDGSAFETISGGGQFGHAFDDWGHRFVCSNSNQIRQVVLPSAEMARNPGYAPPPAVVDIAADGGAGPVFRISPPEPWRVVRTRQRVADPEFVRRAPPSERVVAGFFTSATGVTIYRGSAFPADCLGNAFIGDVGGNLVHRKTVEPAGSIYRAVRREEGREFLASTDNWFRPVNFANTPSGTLLVLDMYRETIEHPASIPDPIKRHLDLTSGHDRGRLYEILPDGFTRRPAPKLSRAATADLVAALGDRDAWWRETAQRLLLERGATDAVPSLIESSRSARSAAGRVHALWTLAALGRLDAETLRPAFDDREPRVREQAAKLARRLDLDDRSLLRPLLGLADDPDAMVRFEAALSLGDSPTTEATGALAKLAARGLDDPWLRAAVLSGLKGRAAAFVARLDNEHVPLDSAEGRGWLEDLATLVAGDDDPEGIATLLARALAEGANSGEAHATLVGLDRGLRRSGGRLANVLKGELAGRLDEQFRRAAARINEADRPEAARLDDIGLLALAPPDSVRDDLASLLEARQPVAVQLAAIRAFEPQTAPQAAAEVTSRWPSMGPAARREAAEWLFRRRERRSALLQALAEKTIAPADLEPNRRKQLLDDADPALRDRARSLLAAHGKDDRAQVIEAYRGAVTLAGEPGRGRELFRRICATCHRAEGQGVNVGPDLETVAARTADDLLVHILDPGREVAPNFVNYAVETTDGRVLTGILADESATSLTLKRGEGVADSVPRSQVERIAATGVSLMPEGLEKDLKPADLADLIAFIRGLKAGDPGR